MFKNIIESVKKTTATTRIKIKAKSPEMLIIGGVVTGIGAAVLACYETTKLNDVTDEIKEDVKSVHEEFDPKEGEEELPEEKKDRMLTLTKTYAKGCVKVAKLYAPSVALGTAATVGILKGNKIHAERNMALAAAYSVISTSFGKYREGVISRFGEEIDKKLRLGIEEKEYEETEVNAKGKEKKVTKTAEASAYDGYSQYARFFDELSPEWEKDPEANMLFINQIREWADRRLRVERVVYLNEVYDALGIPRTSAGQVVGWVYDPEGGEADNHVDFKIYRTNRANREFINGYEPSILLDFNVDGYIFDKVKELETRILAQKKKTALECRRVLNNHSY